MAKQSPFHRIRLVYRHSSLFLKILILVTILVSAAALLALRVSVQSFEKQSQVLQSQAAQLQQENAELSQRIAELGTKDSIRRIATEELDLMNPGAHFFDPGQ